jgi:hypothetical protein
MPAKPPSRPAKAEFSIDEFIGEIEKAEDERLNKRLPQERLRNKRALDNAARRAAEAGGLRRADLGAEGRGAAGDKPKKQTRRAQPVRREDKKATQALGRHRHEPQGPEVEGQRGRPADEPAGLRGGAGRLRAHALRPASPLATSPAPRRRIRR